MTLLETFQFLKSCHRRSPFLFFNGNTFAEIGRALASALFSDLSFHRRKEAASTVAHFITGVLEEELLIAAIANVSQSAEFTVGDRVKTLRGSTQGVVARMMADGRILWRPDHFQAELIALQESLVRV